MTENHIILKKSDIPTSGRLEVWQGGEFSWYPDAEQEGYYYCQLLDESGNVLKLTKFDWRFLREFIVWNVERGLYKRLCKPLHVTQQDTRDW
ncbi:hypothetical protein [Nocardiopsis rhodophaea]